MKLKQIVSQIDYATVIGNGEVEIKGIAIDSKQVRRGQIFIALRGINTDGNDYIAEAIMRGAVAVVSEVTIVDLPVTLVVVNDARSSLAKICSAYYCHPEKSLKFIGVTGTNGKTTVTHLIKGILDKNGYKTGLIGTLGAYYGDNYSETSLTTPDPIELFSTLSDMVSAGVTHVIMEVSAHASRLKKLDGITFDIGVFTNLTQDHLDYFETIENYKQAKLEFLNLNKCKQIVTNVDDETGKEIALSTKSISYGVDNPSDVFAINIEESKNGLKFVVNLFDYVLKVETKLIGYFNVYNVMSALIASVMVGVSPQDAVNAIKGLERINGRLESLPSKNGVSVFIDYAHTPDGLSVSLKALRKITPNKLFCVFGCGGNRDTSKRAVMGEISGLNADFTVITSDNPRFEEPMDIIADVEKGIRKATKKYVIIQKRQDAVYYALSMAKKGDTVLIAGKGAEQYQDILGIKHPYNDKDTVKTYYLEN